MKKRYILICIVVLLLLLGFCKNDLNNFGLQLPTGSKTNLKPASQIVKEVLSDAKPIIASKNTRISDVKISTHAPAPVVLFEKQTPSFVPIPYKPKNTDEAIRFLESKTVEDPSDEFPKLMPLYVSMPRNMRPGDSFYAESTNMTLIFMGVFADRKAKLKLYLTANIDTHELDESSCLILKNEVFRGAAFHFRHDGEGYAVAMVESRWYMRMKYIDDYGRFVGQLFKATENGWQFQEAFDAVPSAVPRAEQHRTVCEILKAS